MIVKCTCDLDVSYRDHVVQQIVIHAIWDTDIRVRVLSRNSKVELTTLTKLIGDYTDLTPYHTTSMTHSLAGWLQIQYSVKRAAYADLNLPLSRLSAGYHPRSSVCDTGATTSPRW